MAKFENRNYDLEERTTRFSGELIVFCKLLPKSTIIISLFGQLIRCGTSIGANYREANGAVSKRDFQNKIFICKKEAKETMYWLELVEKALEEERFRVKCCKLWQEAKELTLIFSRIAASVKS